MNKKGALELSMNSIVIIILAVVFVSVVLVFFQTIFGEQQKNVLNVLDQFPSVNPPTRAEPFKIQVEEPVEVTMGESSARQINAEYLHIGEEAVCGVSINENTNDQQVTFILPDTTARLADGDKVAFSVTAVGNATGTTVYQFDICCDQDLTRANPFDANGKCEASSTDGKKSIERSVQKAFVVKR